MKPKPQPSPYHSREAECAVLFHLATTRQQSKIFQRLKPEDFYHHDCRAMFERMYTAHTKGRPLHGDALIMQAVAPFAAQMGTSMGDCMVASEAVLTMARRRVIADLLEQTSLAISDFAATPSDLDNKIRAIYEAATDERSGGNGEVSMDDAMANTIAIIEQAHRGKVAPGYSTGIAGFDRYQLFSKGDLVVLGARPSVGKTAMAISMAHGLLRRGVKVGFICLEMTTEQITMRFMSQIGQIPFRDLRDGHIDAHMDAFMLAQSEWRTWRDSKQLRLSMGHSDMTPAACCDMIRQWVNEHGIDIVFVDYLQKFAPMDRRDDEVRVVSRCVAAFKNCARELQCVIVLLAQLNRDSDGRRPRLRHLKGSSTIEQEADVIWLMYRPEKEFDDTTGAEPDWPILAETSGSKVQLGKGKAAIFCDKYRNGEDWKLAVDFIGETMTYHREVGA